tara:strand:+ start:11157 stop:12140 length:984 start_codon:yes stop_codon:yes gene_type:complete
MKQLSPKISVIVPVYKVEEVLEECIKSILSQSYENLEIILVDDGSPDKCGIICDEFAKNENRIVVLHQENMGLSMARNNGLKIATGKYVAFIDSDDTIEFNMFESMMDVLQKHNLEVVECTFLINGRIKYGNPEKDKIQVQTLDESLQRLHYKSFFNATNKIFKHTLIKDLSFIKGKIFEDILYMSHVWSKIEKIGFIPTPFYNYSQEGESIQRSNYSQTKIEGLWVINESINNFRKLTKNSKSKEILRRNLLTNLVHNYHALLQNQHLDPKKVNLKKIKKLISENSKLEFINIYHLLINLLPMSLYNSFYKLNLYRIKLQSKKSLK